MGRNRLGYISSTNTGDILSGGIPQYGVATGGTSSTIVIGGSNYTMLAFTSDSNLVVSTTGLFDVYMVGAGGGGGSGSGIAPGVGQAGGGNGTNTGVGGNGTANFGSGGGAAGATTADFAGGSGGKGLVVFRHADTFLPGAAVNATLTQAGGFFIYTFNDSGTIRWA